MCRPEWPYRVGAISVPVPAKRSSDQVIIMSGVEEVTIDKAAIPQLITALQSFNN
jgi:hypothetical protein